MSADQNEAFSWLRNLPIQLRSTSNGLTISEPSAHRSLGEEGELSEINALTFHGTTHDMPNLRRTLPDCPVGNLGTREPASNNQNIRRQSLLQPRLQELIAILERMTRGRAASGRERLRNGRSTSSTNRENDCPRVESRRRAIGTTTGCLDGEKLLVRRELGNRVVIDRCNVRLANKAGHTKVVAIRDPVAVLLEQVARRSEVVLAVALVDCDGRFGPNLKVKSARSYTRTLIDSF